MKTVSESYLHVLFFFVLAPLLESWFNVTVFYNLNDQKFKLKSDTKIMTPFK